MSISIIDSNKSNLRASFRKQRPGPETDMVEQFIEESPIIVPSGCRLTIFREPRLESGFPDIVAVIWHKATMRKFNPDRANIKRSDLRILHLLHQSGPTTSVKLRSIFNCRVDPALERLEAANMLRHVGSNWVPCALSRTFATRRIYAIEAKISNWRGALEQAFLNTWFASDSYILLPKLPRSRQLLEVANSLCIGVFSMSDTMVDNSEIQPWNLPRSYMSWLFNEWVWLEEISEQRK